MFIQYSKYIFNVSLMLTSRSCQQPVNINAWHIPTVVQYIQTSNFWRWAVRLLETCRGCLLKYIESKYCILLVRIVWIFQIVFLNVHLCCNTFLSKEATLAIINGGYVTPHDIRCHFSLFIPLTKCEILPGALCWIGRCLTSHWPLKKEPTVCPSKRRK